MRFLSPLFSFVLILFAPAACAQAPEPEPTLSSLNTATVDLLLEREYIHNVVIDDEQGTVYFERIGAIGSSTAPLPYTDRFAVNGALKKIYAAPMTGGEAQPLFPQQEDTGYYFASADPISPSGRYIAIYRFRDGIVHPGVYDRQQSRIRFSDVMARYEFLSPSMTWISDDEFVFNGESGLSFFDVRVARELAAARERGWRDGEVTADVTGVGRYERQPSGMKVSLMSMNARTGEVREVFRGYNQFLIAWVKGSETAVMGEVIIDPEPAGADVGSERPRILSTVNLLTGEKVQMNDHHQERFRHRSWSGSGRYLLIEPRARRGSDAGAPQTPYIIDVNASEIALRLPAGASNFAWLDDRLIYKLGNDDASGARAGENGEDNAIATPIMGPAPIAASGDFYYYLNGGDLWRASLNGVRENLTADYDNDIRRYRHSRRAASHPAEKSDRWRTPAPHDLQFETEIDGRRTLIMVTADGIGVVEIPFPSQDSQAYAATPEGAAFLTNTYGVGSTLEYVPAGGAPRSLYSFNRQLADVTPAAGPIRIDHTGYDGRDAIGWLYLPPGASVDNPRPYPLVVVSYPSRVYGDVPPIPHVGYAASIWDVDLGTNTKMELYAAQGYAVLLPSVPIGPYGRAGEPMTRMMPAVLSAVDGAIEIGFADPGRMALVGQSYGGYGALSVAVQTDRFQAIIAMASSSNYMGLYGEFVPSAKLSNFISTHPISGILANRVAVRSFETGVRRMGAPPWVDPDRYLRNSPLFYVDQVTTPIMLIHGELDTATLITQAEEMITGLYREGKDALFVRYNGEHHIFEQPQNQRDMWERIFAFLEENGVTPGPREIEPLEASPPH